MSFLPIFVDLSRGPVVLTGANDRALAKLELLRARGANIVWFPMEGDGQAQADMGRDSGGLLQIATGEPRAADLDRAAALIAAAGGDADERLAREARGRGIPVNVVDRPELSTFIFPAIVDRGDVVVAISTGGAAPVLARRLRERIEAVLPARIGELAALMGFWRRRLRARFGSGGSRQLWERFIDGPVGQGVLEGRSGEAQAWFAALSGEGSEARQNPLGSVALVGAGPGDPDLLTLKALHALQDADVVFYDELVTPEILERVRRDAARIFVGKRKGKSGEGQDAINRRMIDAAKDGARVVRLKGGDPFVFGRGGEELEALRAAGIPVSVVPGITAAIGAAAEWEIPLTYRREASELVFVTAHRANEDDAIAWVRLADPQTTLAIYMGLSSADAIRDRLIAAGRSPATPAAVLARATRPDSQGLAGRLTDLPELAERAGEGPAILIVGDVVARSKLWRKSVQSAREAALEPA